MKFNNNRSIDQTHQYLDSLLILREAAKSRKIIGNKRFVTNHKETSDVAQKFTDRLALEIDRTPEGIAGRHDAQRACRAFRGG